MNEAKRKGPRHPIGVVADRTGLTTHVLRAWESRYGVVQPERSEGGHRMYSDEELRRLRLLARLTDAGYRIGQLAELSDEELERRVSEETPRATAGEGEPGPAAGERLGQAALQAVSRLEFRRLETLLHRAALALTTASLVDDVLVPLLGEVGERWEAGELGAAEEHAVSAVVQRTLGWLLETLEVEDGAPGLVVATPRGHRHHLGAMLAGVVAASEGWRVVDLGADLPAGEIARLARDVDARLVLLGLVYPDADPGTVSELEELADRLPEEVGVVAGGRAASSYAGALRSAGGRTLEDYDELRRLLARRLGRERQGGRPDAPAPGAAR